MPCFPSLHTPPVCLMECSRNVTRKKKKKRRRAARWEATGVEPATVNRRSACRAPRRTHHVSHRSALVAGARSLALK